MTKEDAEIIYWSLAMRKNYIETGDVCLSAVDAKNIKENKKIRPLTIDSMKILIKIEELMGKCLKRM